MDTDTNSGIGINSNSLESRREKNKPGLLPRQERVILTVLFLGAALYLVTLANTSPQAQQLFNLVLNGLTLSLM